MTSISNRPRPGIRLRLHPGSRYWDAHAHAHAQWLFSSVLPYSIHNPIAGGIQGWGFILTSSRQSAGRLRDGFFSGSQARQWNQPKFLRTHPMRQALFDRCQDTCPACHRGAFVPILPPRICQALEIDKQVDSVLSQSSSKV